MQCSHKKICFPQFPQPSAFFAFQFNHYFFFRIFFCLHVWMMCLSVPICALCTCNAHRGQKKVSDLLKCSCKGCDHYVVCWELSPLSGTIKDLVISMAFVIILPFFSFTVSILVLFPEGKAFCTASHKHTEQRNSARQSCLLFPKEPCTEMQILSSPFLCSGLATDLFSLSLHQRLLYLAFFQRNWLIAHKY